MDNKKATEDAINRVNAAKEEISRASSLGDIYLGVEKLICELTGSDSTTLFSYDPKKQTLYTSKNDKSLEFPMIRPEGLLGQSFLTKKPMTFNYVASEKYYVPDIDNIADARLKAQLIVPILDEDNLKGIVRVSRYLGNNLHYTRKEIDIIQSLVQFFKSVMNKIEVYPEGGAPFESTSTELGQKIEKIEENKANNPEINSTMLFLSNTVHDIRTPANSLYGFLEVLEEQIQDKRLKVFIENAKESAAFINNLTDSILQQVKEIHEIETSTPTVVNSVKFFSQVGDIFSANMCKKGIHYVIHISPNMPKEISIDKLKLKRIMINLIGNAYKFTPSDKRIDFRALYRPETKDIYVEVVDQGLGIEESRQKMIFESFKQAEEDTSKHFGGTGLGLAISSRYVSDLGGKLELKSALGEGSTFHFTVPVDVVDASSSQQKFSDLDKKILLYSDNPNCTNVRNIYNYLISLGMPQERIEISAVFDPDATHFFCFQHKLSDEILESAAINNMKIVIVEEELFSLNKDAKYAQYEIISENTYYGDKVHSAVYSGKKTKILLADDSKVNIVLLRAMLETEYCEIVDTTDGEAAYNLIKDGYLRHEPFDLAFLDEHMPNLSGSEIMEKVRRIELKQNVKKLFAVSITGDPNMKAEEGGLYDLQVNKPFKKQDVKDALKKVMEHN